MRRRGEDKHTVAVGVPIDHLKRLDALVESGEARSTGNALLITSQFGMECLARRDELRAGTKSIDEVESEFKGRLNADGIENLTRGLTRRERDAIVMQIEIDNEREEREKLRRTQYVKPPVF